MNLVEFVFLLDPVKLDEWFRTCIHDNGCIRVPGMDEFMVGILQLPTKAHLTITVSFLCMKFFLLSWIERYPSILQWSVSMARKPLSSCYAYYSTPTMATR